MAQNCPVFLSSLFGRWLDAILRAMTKQLLRPPGKPIPPYLMVKLDEVGSG
jgi:hypothetical protein